MFTIILLHAVTMVTEGVLERERTITNGKRLIKGPMTSFRDKHFYLNPLPHCGTIPGLKTLEKKPIENIVGKGENAGNQHFLHFQGFLPIQGKTSLLEPF